MMQTELTELVRIDWHHDQHRSIVSVSTLPYAARGYILSPSLRPLQGHRSVRDISAAMSGITRDGRFCIEDGEVPRQSLFPLSG